MYTLVGLLRKLSDRIVQKFNGFMVKNVPNSDKMAPVFIVLGTKAAVIFSFF